MFIINGEQQPHGSINRVYYPETSTEIPSIYHGLKAFDLLSTAAIKHFYTQNHLVFPKIYESDQRFLDFFNDYGHRLAYMFYILKNGMRKGYFRVDWNDDDWLYWSKIKHVILGGGICESFWPFFAPSFEKHINQLELDITIEKHAFPSEIVLHGLRYHCLPNEDSLLLDFGGTRIKRMIITNNKIDSLKMYNTNEWITTSASSSVIQFLSEQTLDTFDNLFISIASYLKDEVPVSQSGLFGQIGSEVGNIKNFLRSKLNFEGNLEVFHDTSVAADPYRQQKNTVVVTLGTAIGVGYI